MNIQFFTIPIFDNGAESEQLNKFLSAHRIIKIEREFVQNSTQSVWAICVTYQAHANSSEPTRQKSRIDYKQLLSEDDFAVFSQLRDLRKRLAEEQGVPVYVVFTNEQLSAMVLNKVTTVSQLLEIEGVGDGRVDKYGQAFIEQLRRLIVLG